MMRRAWWVVVVLLLVGCSGVVSQQFATTQPTTMPTPHLREAATSVPQVNIPQTVPSVDVTRHSVPLEDIYFDTFQPTNRAIPLSTASPELIRRLQDAIPPIHKPKYQSVAEASWLHDEDMVIGYTAGGQAWAYPIRILNFHEIVNDTLAGEEVLISYCPLCFSGIVFSRQLGDKVIT